MRRVANWVMATSFMCLGFGQTQAQSAYGPGGLFMIPSATVSAKGAVGLGMMGGIQDMWVAAKGGKYVRAHDHGHFWLSNAVAYGLSEKTEIGVTNILLRNDNARPTWGGFAKYQLRPESGKMPALAVSGVWLPVWHWRTETVSFGGTKTVSIGGRTLGHVHLGAMHARWLNGVKTDRNPLAPTTPDAPVSPDYDPKRPVVRQVPFAGVDIDLGNIAKLTLEGRGRTIADHPDALPGMAGIIFKLPYGSRLGFAYGTDGLSDTNSLTIGVGYNISTVD